VAADVGAVVSKWRDEARRTGIPEAEINRMASAFEHEHLQKATALANKTVVAAENKDQAAYRRRIRMDRTV
jgi:hypothetical protein